MIDQLRNMSVWVVGFAESDWAILLLGMASFTESIFSPIPPDPLLVGMGLLKPHLAIWLGVFVAVSSVAGAVVAHWIGHRLGRPILYRLFAPKQIDRVERTFKKYGVWATLIAAFTPIPYKIFAISAGVLDLDRRTFILASLIGRGVRYISIGMMIFIFGESIEIFITNNFQILTIGLAIVLISSVVTWALINKHHHTRNTLH